MRAMTEMKARVEAAMPVGVAYALPSVLVVNAVGLVTLERLGAIPEWIKVAAAMFLAF